MRTYMFRALSLLLVTGSIVLLGWAHWLWKNPLPIATERPVAPWSPELSANVVLNEPVKSTYDKEKVFAHPVFSPTRRPFAALLMQPPVQPEQMIEQPTTNALTDSSQFQLKGILLSSSRTAALIATPEHAEGKWYVGTDDIMGWKIAKISANSVELTSMGQSITIQQYVDNSQLPLGTHTSPN
jgi:type II secretory pathway component PulC